MKNFGSSVLRAATAGALLVACVSTHAVSLRPGKATDASVCDMSHNTNGFLGGKMLVPAVATPKDQVDAFFRMAASFIAGNCSNGQLLILQGSSDVSVDAPSLTQVANSACWAADVKRSEITVNAGDRTFPGFELRCTIAKHSELLKQLADLERTDPMDALKARLVAAIQQAEGRGTTGASGSSKKDCDKMSLSGLLQGGRCK